MRASPLLRALTRKLLPAVFITLFVIANAPAQAPTSILPSLGDLKKIKFEPSSQPDLVAVPSYSELKESIISFQNYVRGLSLVAGFQEPILTRGGQGIAVYRKAAAAVVFVVAANIREGQITDAGIGSGVIVDSSGYVLTNWHVVKDFEGVVVFLKPGGGASPNENLGYAARLVARNPQKDLALLKIVKPPANLPIITIGSMAQIQVAQDIHVIGHPGSEHAWTYTTGVVSQIRRNYEGYYSDGSYIRANVIQIQTAINPGNSGGPVLDDDGKMIGLASFSLPGRQNLNFAIAGDEISQFLSTSKQIKTRGFSSQTSISGSVQAEYFTGTLGEVVRLIKARYPDMVVYFVRDQNGRAVGLVAETSDGDVIKAWQPGPTGGFNQWSANFADGATVEGKGEAGLPELFAGK